MGRQSDSDNANRVTIVFGAFKAMGDLLCACPVMRSELEAGSQIHLLLFDNKSLVEFVKLVDFGPNRERLRIHRLPIRGGLEGLRAFFREMSEIDPDLVWISPHAPRPASSWKIPLLLWLTQRIYWKKAILAGAKSERLSFLFNRRLPVDRNLPFERREWEAFYGLRGDVMEKWPLRVSFLPEITAICDSEPVYDLLIHPGANAKNRTWPYDRYLKVVGNLPPERKIGVVGLPNDIAALKEVLPRDRPIDYLTGSLTDLLVAIARCRVLLTMDSGNVHFARVLRTPTVALFGKSDPANVIPLGEIVTAIYEKNFPCQPCGKAYCSQPDVYCMTTLSPSLVVRAIEECWARPKSGHYAADGFRIIS